MDRISDFLVRYERCNNLPQTHMWMSADTCANYSTSGAKTKTLILHVPENEMEFFYENIGSYIDKTKIEDLQSPRSDNCITEKIYNDKFRFYIDIDFSINIFENNILSSDKSTFIR